MDDQVPKEPNRNAPRPLQIIDFVGDSGQRRDINLHKKNLDSILKQAGDRRIALVTIAGPMRQGKSFLLGFMIRYLQALENDESDWMDWDDMKKPLVGGFVWRTGTDHETNGMVMWSKPFIVKSNDTEIAILLLDTQGTFDEFTTPREMTSIVGLSLLTSSCMIFNFFTNLSEDVLTSLETYIEYGQLALSTPDRDGDGDQGTEGSSKPFQKLLFLIRDWNTPSEFPYGDKGGEKFLEKKLQIKPGQAENAQKVRKTLKECFDKLDCFLMPDPGEKAKEAGFNGSLAQLSKKFADKVEELINKLLDPDEIPLNSVFGSPVVASDMLNYFEKYVEVFNGDELPDPATLMNATAHIANTTLVNSFLRKYLENIKKKQRGKKFLPEKGLLKIHKTCMEEAIKGFQKNKKLGDPEMIQGFEEDLRFQIKEKFDSIEDENSRKKSKIIETAVGEGQESFKESVREALGDDEESFLEEKRLKSILKNQKESAIDEFKEKMNELDASEIEQLETNLQEILEENSNRFITENENKRMKMIKKLQDLIKTECDLLAEDVNDKLNEDELIAEEELAEFIKEKRKDAVDSYNKKKKSGSKDFQKQYSTQLETDLDRKIQEIKNTYQLKIQELEESISNSFDETINELETTFTEALEKLNDPALVDEEQQKFIQKAEEEVKSKLPILKQEGSPLGKKMWAKLQPKIQDTLEKVTTKITLAKKQCEESYQNAVDEAFQVYFMDVDGFIKKEAFYDEAEIKDKHDKTQTKALETYNNSPKVEGNFCNPSEFEEKLTTQIQNHFEKTMEHNVEKREKAYSDARNKHHEALGNYQTEMLSKLDTARDEDHLQDIHQDVMRTALDTFKTAVSAVIKDVDLDPLVEVLAEEINACKEEIKEVFELKVLERESGTTSAIADARKFYKEEMKKHYNNCDFMMPKALEELHEKMSQTAIRKCTDSTALSEMQKDDLKKALLLTFEKYKEQNDMNVPVDPAIGIDLGTTYSCVGVYHNGKVKIIPNAQGKNTTPSYICYDDRGFAVSVGIPAKDKAYENAEQTVFDAKRIIGRGFQDQVLQNDMKFWPFKVIDDKQVPKIEVGGKIYFPEAVSAEVLKEMRVIAEKYLNCEVKNAVITVPAYFTDGQREATMDAGELAGLNVLKILNEPVSAAVAYKLQHNDDDTRHVLVYDLGGGTFDVAILKLSKGVIDTLAVDGDTHLGGEDFDQNVMKFCATTFKSEHGIDLMEGKDSTNDLQRQEVRRRLKRLQLKCEQRKIELASCQTVDIDVDGIYNEAGTSLDLKVTLSRSKFEELNEGLFEKTIEIVERCLTSAGLDKGKIDDIVLVGGSTRIPKVQALLIELFKGKALNKTINPDEAVAYGAAVQAAILNGQIAKESIDFNKIQDVVPMSLGVEVYGGGFSIIIPKNTKIPVKFKEQYRTAHNNQTSVQITISQGESDVANENTFLGDFILNGIPPAEAGREVIYVTMEINLQGVLHVTAVCNSTGDKGSITVTENKRRMGKEQIKKILAEGKPGAA